jgi:uncharacterized protein YcbX
MSELGRIEQLWRYPVKSFLGEPLGSARLDGRGVEGDRLFAVRDARGKFGSGKTTRRFQQIDGLFRFQAAWGDGVPEIVFPGGRQISGADPRVHAVLSEELGQPVTLAREAGVSHFDAGPVHLVTTASLRWLGALLGPAVDARRFRPNLVVDAPGDRPVEQAWRGALLRIGAGVELRVTDPTVRCVMVGFAQPGVEADPRVLRVLAAHAGACFGVYADVVTPGTVALGDAVTLA